MLKRNIRSNSLEFLIVFLTPIIFGGCQSKVFSSKRKEFPTTIINHEEHGCFGVLDRPTIVIEQVSSDVIAKTHDCDVILNKSQIDSVSHFYKVLEELQNTEEDCDWLDNTYVLTIKIEDHPKKTFISSCDWPLKELLKFEKNLFKNCN